MKRLTRFGLALVSGALAVVSGCSSKQQSVTIDGLLLAGEVATAVQAPSKPGERCLSVQFTGSGSPANICTLDRIVKKLVLDPSEVTPGSTIGFVGDGYDIVLVWDGGRVPVPVDKLGFFALYIPPSVGARDLVALDRGKLVAGCTWERGGSGFPGSWSCGRVKEPDGGTPS
jgi:hypothetical protein